MANKIPVGQIIGKAYRFAFGDLGAVLGVVWLPIAMVVVAGYFLFRGISIPRIDMSNPAGISHAVMTLYMVVMGPLQILQLVMWVAAIVIEVGLTRAALGIGRRPLVFFTLGWPFWRMLGANLIFAVILMIAMVPLFLGIAIIVGAGTGLSAYIDPRWVGAPAFLLCMIGLGAFYYIYARLWFFIAPVVVAEKHIDLRRGWHLAKGNVLRIIAILFGVALPPLLITAAAEGVAFYLMIWNRPFGTLPDSQFFAAHSLEFAAIGVVVALVWLFAVALIQSARAFAYRALVPADAPPAAA